MMDELPPGRHDGARHSKRPFRFLITGAHMIGAGIPPGSTAVVIELSEDRPPTVGSDVMVIIKGDFFPKRYQPPFLVSIDGSLRHIDAVPLEQCIVFGVIDHVIPSSRAPIPAS